MARPSAIPTMGANERTSRKEAVMFKKIIWATDGSANADAALPVVRALAETDDARIFAVHCTELFVAGRASGYPVAADEDELQDKIRSQVEELRGAGMDVKLVLVQGQASETARLVANAARKLDADVIVTGTRGHGVLTGAIAGSVTQRLLHAAPCPVLAVGPPSRRGKRRQPETAAVSG
jgi:nucleotide-binding universal stress UspA family protein